MNSVVRGMSTALTGAAEYELASRNPQAYYQLKSTQTILVTIMVVMFIGLFALALIVGAVKSENKQLSAQNTAYRAQLAAQKKKQQQ